MSLVVGAAQALSRAILKIKPIYEDDSVVIQVESRNNGASRDLIMSLEELMSKGSSIEDTLQCDKGNVSLKIALVLAKKMGWQIDFTGDVGRLSFTLVA